MDREADRLDYLAGLGDDLGADAVAGQKRNVVGSSSAPSMRPVWAGVDVGGARLRASRRNSGSTRSRALRLERDERRGRDRLGREVVRLVDAGRLADLAEPVDAERDEARAEAAAEEGERVRGAVDDASRSGGCAAPAGRAARGATARAGREVVAGA